MYFIKRNIANSITLLNLLCGLIAILYAFGGHLNIAALFIALGICLDFLDGMIARALKINSNLGKQLDSFSDLITFGVAPSIIIFQLIYYTESGTFFNPYDDWIKRTIYSENYWVYTAFLIPIFSSLRLARFNIKHNKKDDFIGLPTPANALFFISIPLMITFQKESLITQWISQTHILIILCFIMSSLLISKISLFTLKFQTFNWDNNRLRYILILSSIILLSLLHFAAIPFIVSLYIILSIINTILKNEI